MDIQLVPVYNPREICPFHTFHRKVHEIFGIICQEGRSLGLCHSKRLTQALQDEIKCARALPKSNPAPLVAGIRIRGNDLIISGGKGLTIISNWVYFQPFTEVSLGVAPSVANELTCYLGVGPVRIELRKRSWRLPARAITGPGATIERIERRFPGRSASQNRRRVTCSGWLEFGLTCIYRDTSMNL